MVTPISVRLQMVIFVVFCGSSLSSCAINSNAGDNELNTRIDLPAGFNIEFYHRNVPGARSMTQASDGTLFVGTRGEGKVYAIQDKDNDFVADEIHEIDSNLNMPNGVAFREGSLYVAEVNRILRYDNILSNLTDPPDPVIVFDQLPSDRHHGWKFIAFGPDDKLYVPVGAPCNICLSEDPVYASITRLNPDGTGYEIYAHGVRNTVGFDWHPETGELWFTDNGRDWLGDDVPPDELNRVREKGQHFGYPFLHGADIEDPDIVTPAGHPPFIPPAFNLNAHVAALGMRFYQGHQFPAEYSGAVFIAEHGSWNRSEPDGYRIMVVKLNDNEVESVQVFASGWLNYGNVWGRPVDVEELPDGSLLVSDDKAGAIYRISYSG